MPASPPTAKDPRATPAMRQYAAFKERHPDCVLFFRMGDFYEMFDDDALVAHRTLGIALTERTKGVPMAGVPHHSVEGYLRRMLAAGHRVAVCEQVQDPKEASGVVERAVTRVLTPGTLSEDGLLDEGDAAALGAVCFLDPGDDPAGRVSCAVVDASTGAFIVFDTTADRAADELARRDVRELLVAQTADGEAPPRARRVAEASGAALTPRPAWQFRTDEALEALLGHFRVATLAGFGLGDDDPAVAPAGACLRYLIETQAPDADPGRSALAHLAPPRRDDPDDALVLDVASLRALEILQTMRTGAPDGSLLGLFTGRSAPRTPMGRRLIRQWLVRPLARREPIEERQGAVATLVEDPRVADDLDAALKPIQDLARVAGRVGVGRASPRDLAAIGASLARLQEVRDSIAGAPALARLAESLDERRAALTPIAQRIARTLVESPPPSLRDGGVIADGVDAALDEARAMMRDASAYLAQYQTRVAEEFDLPGVKIGFNRVFGYYLELTKAQARSAPDVFLRKQTLKNAERYITPELKAFEEKITGAESSAQRREQAVFSALADAARAHAPDVRAAATLIAQIDALACLARVARARGWSRPTITDEPILEIRDGAHPVLSAALGDRFVPNDAALGTPDQPARLALITGPNMAGKSTYLRQVALIALLAHTGSWVPARSATVGLTDRIFTRVGADDALHAGQSTFMVEMVETASILHHASARSLVILDEVGRGTSTLDGLALAWAIAERLTGDGDAAPTPRTLFATHYHELTTLEDDRPDRVRNLHVTVREWGDEIVFLHRIEPGRTDRSYGVHVARLAGLPASVVARARGLLETLAVTHEGAGPASLRTAARSPAPRMPLFTEFLEHPALADLRGLDLDTMTPMQAFDALR
ncbi:MAG: DNA mismatch repair protein MutS, partial [Planctomycetota bacterium]